MSSVLFRIEAYGHLNYGCPDFDLMGYDDVQELLGLCWKRFHKDAECTKSEGDENE